MIENRLSVILGEKLEKITDVAKNTGISRTTLTSMYYKRDKRISYDTLDKLCIYLNCTIADLIVFKKEEQVGK